MSYTPGGVRGRSGITKVRHKIHEMDVIKLGVQMGTDDSNTQSIYPFTLHDNGPLLQISSR